MKKMLLLFVILSVFYCIGVYAQKKYGYTVLYLRCGNEEPSKNKVYYSPIIELDRLNFPKFTEGMDPNFPKFSVRYYNYAIAKWFETYLKAQYGVAVNDPEHYQRKATSMVYDNKSDGSCNSDKTEPGCFFTDQQKLILIRKNAITESKLSKNNTTICQVIGL